MDQWLTETADTKRKGSVNASGFEQSETANLTNQAITPVMPVDAYTIKQKGLGEFAQVHEAFVKDCDIIDDDLITTGGTEYRVVAVEEWPWRSTVWLWLFLEEVV